MNPSGILAGMNASDWKRAALGAILGLGSFAVVSVFFQLNLGWVIGLAILIGIVGYGFYNKAKI